MDPVLTWLLLIAAVILILLAAVPLDMIVARWRELFIGTSQPDQPPPLKMAAHDPTNEL